MEISSLQIKLDWSLQMSFSSSSKEIYNIIYHVYII